MRGSSAPTEQYFSSDLRLLSLNYEYLLASCSEPADNSEICERIGQIELDVAALYWGLSRDERTQLAEQFRAFLQMKRNCRSR